jgi:4-amino-4-deoxy-L-arabinose transferase-like glycosyltransferase
MELPTPAFPRKTVLSFTLAGLALRLWFNLLQHPLGKFIFSDMGVYDQRAQNLLSGHLGPWDTFTPVGYPAFLAVFYALTHRNLTVVAVIHALMGAAVAWLVARISWRLNRSPAAAVAVCVLAASYLPLVSYGGLIMSELPYCFFTTLTVLLVIRARENPSRLRLVQAGLCLAFTTWIRPQMLLFYPFLPVYFFAAFRPDRKKALKISAAVFASAAPLILIAAVYNSILLRRPAGLGSNGGLNFFFAHSEYKTAETKIDGRVVYSITPIPNGVHYTKLFSSEIPLYDEAYFYRKGLGEIAARPSRILTDFKNVTEGLGLGRTGYWPGWEKYRFLLEAFRKPFFWVIFLPASAGLLLAAFRKRLFNPEGADRLLLALMLVSALLTLYLFLGDPRMRVTYDPLLFVMAADFFAVFLDRLGHGQREFRGARGAAQVRG